MFCEKCGKELKNGWKKCPYCGQMIGESCVKAESKTEIPRQATPISSERSFPEKEPKKKGKVKKVLLGIGVVFLILVVIAIITPSGDDSSSVGSNEKSQEASEEIKTLEDVGGFAQWQEDGFPGKVRANISVEFPLGNTDKNNYAVYIGMGGINVGVIMQEDEKPVKEWEWLMDAEPDEDTKKAYFNGVLKYLGDNKDEKPVFVISDVKEGDYLADVWTSDVQEDEDVESENLSEIEKTDMDNITMYLTNDSQALPVKIENVYQENVYMGFTTFSFDMVNTTDIDIKTAKFGVVAWDSNMLPLELTEMYDVESEYFYRCQGGNIAAGQTSQASVEFEERDFKYMQILLLEYIDFDGNTWTNPAAVYYEENFAGKKFDENTMTAMVFDENSVDNTDDNDDMNGGISDNIENQKDIINCTGDFVTDVANGILYGKDGIIVDANGNALSEYADYFITEQGYISNGDWCEEGYIVDDTGQIIQFQM